MTDKVLTTAELILVVDDDPTLRVLVRAALEKSGFRVEEAGDGAEALEKFVSHKPSAIMMDVEMPKFDGYSACKRIRQDPAGAHIPILMVTGREDLESVNRAYSAGATDFIPKPINWNMLGHRIRYVLRAARAFDDLRASQAKNDALLRAIPDTLFVVRRNGEIVDFVAGDTAGPLDEPRGDQTRIFDYLPSESAKLWHSLILDVASNKMLQS